MNVVFREGEMQMVDTTIQKQEGRRNYQVPQSKIRVGQAMKDSLHMKLYRPW